MAKMTCSEMRIRLKEANSRIEELSRELETLCSDDGLLQAVRGNKEVKNAVIGEYLESLMKGGVSLIGSGGYTPLTPVAKPKTLADAKRLADKIIRS